MEKRRGQTIVEFVMIAGLGISLVVIGLYQYGDRIADTFSGGNPERTFNNARTVRFENPEDLMSNVTVRLGGAKIVPPIEAVMESGIPLSYIQTSGSAGQMQAINLIIKSYAETIKQIASASGPLETQLNNIVAQADANLTTISTYISNNNQLGLKVKMINDSIKAGGATNVYDDADSALSTFITANSISGNKKTILENFMNDLLGIRASFDFYIHPTLYSKYLDEDKRNTPEQDNRLLEKLKTLANTTNDDGTRSDASMIKVYMTGGFSQFSTDAYNSERMCSRYQPMGATMRADGKNCDIPLIPPTP